MPAAAPSVGLGMAVYPNPERIAGPSPYVTADNGTVLEPITRAELSSKIGVPEMVTGEPPR